MDEQFLNNEINYLNEQAEKRAEYADQKADSRMDYIAKHILAIRIWITIIGFYFLSKIIITLIILTTEGAVISQILNRLVE